MLLGLYQGKQVTPVILENFRKLHMEKPLVEILKAFSLNSNSVYQYTDIAVSDLATSDKQKSIFSRIPFLNFHINFKLKLKIIF